MERVEVIGKEGGLFDLIQKVWCSRWAETMGEGQYWGPARTKTRGGEKGVPGNPPQSIVASGSGDRPISKNLTTRFARDPMSEYEGVFYVV